MKLGYDFYRSLILINKNLTKEIFIEKVGASKGYSLDMFSRMYDSLTSELIDLEREYSKYYSFEYTTFESFLYKKYNLKTEDIKELITAKKENPDCKLYRKHEGSYGSYGLDTFAFSETMYERIINIIMLTN